MIIPVGYAQATYVFTSGNLPFGAVTTCGHSVALASGTLQDQAAVLYDAFADNVLGALNASINFDRVILKEGPNESGNTAEFIGVLTGGDGGSVASPNVAYLVEKQTALGGRRGRGRMFLPGASEPVVGGSGALDLVFAADVQTNLGTWMTRLETENLNPVVFHSNALAPTPVTAFNLDGMAATQRRRMRR